MRFSRVLRGIVAQKRPFDVSIVRRGKLRVLAGILALVTVGGTLYGYTTTTRADAINSTDFVTTWKTDNAGISNNSSITIPVNGWSTYNYSVDWNNDGTPDQTGITGSVTHDFGVPGTYTIRISGTFPAVYFYLNSDAQKILEVNQWGNNHWETMQNAFMGARNLAITAVDAPDLSGVVDMTSMFYEASSMNQNLNSWDVSNVRFMRNLFAYASAFNQPLSNWNTGNVRDMAGMFYSATAFNQDIGGWNTASVTDTNGMFSNANTFNNGGSTTINNWNTGNVTDMSAMFQHAVSFDQPIGNWNTSAVTTMTRMFQSATAFNQSLAAWNTGNVVDMNSMFYFAQTFNGSIDGWDTSSVVDMGSMFTFASNFNQPLNSWNTGAVTNMRSMFYLAAAFNQPLGNWNTSGVIDFGYMFAYASNFDQPIGNWATNSATTFTSMFSSASSFNQPIENWNTSSVTDIAGMFTYATTFNQPLNAWDTSSVMNMSSTFLGATAFNQPLSSWDTHNVTNMSQMFEGASSFNQPLNTWNTSNVTNMAQMFQSATAFNRSLAAWNITGIASHTSWLTSLANMLSSSGLSQANYDATLAAWSVLSVNSGVELGADGLTYCSAATERQSLIDNYGWTISNDVYGCTAPSAPQNLTASTNQDVATLGWEAPATNGTGTFTGYTVQYKLSSDSSWTSLPSTTNLSVTIPNLSLGSSYDFQVLAVSSHGTSAPSNTSTVTTDSAVTQTVNFETLGSEHNMAVAKAVLSVTSSACYNIHGPSLSVLGPSGVDAPEGITILGGLAYSLMCSSTGGATNAAITLGTYHDDVSKIRIYKKSGSATLQDITSSVVIRNHLQSGVYVTTIDYTLIDGGAFDEDGIANGTIVDPVYVGLVTTGASGSSTSLAKTGKNAFAAASVAIVVILSGFCVLYRKLAV